LPAQPNPQLLAFIAVASSSYLSGTGNLCAYCLGLLAVALGLCSRPDSGNSPDAPQGNAPKKQMSFFRPAPEIPASPPCPAILPDRFLL